MGDMINHLESLEGLIAFLLVVSLEKEFISHLLTSSSYVSEKPVQQAGPTSRGHLYFTGIEPTTRTLWSKAAQLAGSEVCIWLPALHTCSVRAPKPDGCSFWNALGIAESDVFQLQ